MEHKGMRAHEALRILISYDARSKIATSDLKG